MPDQGTHDSISIRTCFMYNLNKSYPHQYNGYCFNHEIHLIINYVIMYTKQCDKRFSGFCVIFDAFIAD